MESGVPLSIREIIRLKTICVGKAFSHARNDVAATQLFPANLIAQSADFDLIIEPNLEAAYTLLRKDQSLDLLFLDADDTQVSTLTTFVTRLRELRPRLPIIVFSDEAGDTMRYLLRSGATWHYLKSSPHLDHLAADINRHIIPPAHWEDIFEYYARDEVKPRIEPGLGFEDLEATRQNPEELYIIKRLFTNSDVVQIFRMDEGFSGSRIYTVKPRHQLKRILKIGTVDDLEAVQEKQESLIQPRLFRQVGQIRGNVVSAQHLAGACYSLAGSNQEVLTLSQFLQDQNQVRKDLLDKIIDQIGDSLSELYTGSVETELRYWAPLYSRVLPPALTIESAVWVEDDDAEADYVLDAREMTAISAVPNSRTLAAINDAVKRGDAPQVILRGFEIAEVNSAEGVLYLRDTLVEQYQADPILKNKEHPLLRFKVHLQPSQVGFLNHPVFRRGKRVAIRGLVCDTQDTVLARQISEVSGETFSLEDPVFQFASGSFISPLENIRFLLWEVGREDMIFPAPYIAPVVHGDLNAGNILIEANSEVPIWLIDFSDASAGHVYFDLAKLEVEFRTHVFFRLFREMVDERLWDSEKTTKFLLLIEHLLIQHAGESFESFAAILRDYQSQWYDDLYTQFPLYFENLLYFLFALRRTAAQFSPDRFQQHYPVALFFQSMAALKYDSLAKEPWQPWAKRLALCCALVYGKEAVAQSKRPQDITRLLGQLRQRSALTLIAVGQGERRKYLMQWNKNWERFNLVGGRINNNNGDRDSFARALQRKISEELGLQSPKDYHIVRERKPVIRRQFSRRQHVFKDYEFRVFEVELLPRHPRNEDEFARYSQRFAEDRENVLLTPFEISQLRTIGGQPVSETTRIVLQVIGEIEERDPAEQASAITLQLDELCPIVTRGRARVTGTLLNAEFGNLIENVIVEVLPRPGYAVDPQSESFRIRQLDVGYDYPIEIGLQPREADTKLTLRVTYYDTRGNEYRQLIEHPIQFRTPAYSLFDLDNPYVVSKPVGPGSEAVFVGREDIFSWIGSSLLESEKARSLIVYGPPKTGKSSLLLQLANGALGQRMRELIKDPVLTIYFNLQDLRFEHSSELFSQLCKVVSRALRNHGIALPMPEAWSANGNGFRAFDQYLDVVESAIPDSSRLLLAIDGLDHLRTVIEEGRLSYDSLAYLRSLMQLRSHISFVFAGSENLVDEFWHLLFNAAETREMNYLDRRQTERLIRGPVQPQMYFDDLAVEQIWRWTGGHPYLVQLVCSRLVERINDEDRRGMTVDNRHLEAVRESVLQDNDVFLLALWTGSTAAEQLVLAAAAECAIGYQAQITGSMIADRLRLSPVEARRSLTPALESLSRRKLLIPMPATVDLQADGNRGANAREAQNYLFAFELLHLWLQENRPISDVLKATPSTTESAIGL